MPPQGNCIGNCKIIEFNNDQVNNCGYQGECTVDLQETPKDRIECAEYSYQNLIFGLNTFTLKNFFSYGKSYLEYFIKRFDTEISNVVGGENKHEYEKIFSKDVKIEDKDWLAQKLKHENSSSDYTDREIHLPEKSPDSYEVDENFKSLIKWLIKIKSNCENKENGDCIFLYVYLSENAYKINDNSMFIVLKIPEELDKFDDTKEKLLHVTSHQNLIFEDAHIDTKTLNSAEKKSPEIFRRNNQLNFKFTNHLIYKWTIKNFDSVCNDPSVMYLESMKETLTTDGGPLQFSFCLHYQDCRKQNDNNVLSAGTGGNGENEDCVECGDGDNDDNNISLWINFAENLSKLTNTNTLVILLRVSILDSNEVLQHTKVCRIYSFHYKRNVTKFGWKKYISSKLLRQSKNALLKDDKLTIYFEIDTIEYGNESLSESTNMTNVEKFDNFSDSNFTFCVLPLCGKELPKSVNTTSYMIKHEHTWTLSNFRKYLYEHLAVDEIGQDHLTSNSFSPLISDDYKFKLNLSRNKIKSYCVGKNESQSSVDQISIFLTCENAKNPAGKLVQFRISLIDRNQLKWNSKKSIVKYDFENYKYGFENYIQTDYLFENSEKLLENDELTIVCEIFIQENWSDQENKEFGINDQYVIGDFKSQWESKRLSDCTSKSKSITKLQVYQCSHQWTIGEFSQLQNPNPFRQFYIDFPKFKPTNYNKIDFSLRLYPKNDKLLKMCLFVNSNEIADAIVLFDLSFLVPKRVRTNTKVGRIKISNGNRIEWSEFEINRVDIFDPKNELLHDDELEIYCKVKICLNPITESVDYPEIRILNELSHYFDTKQTSDVTLHFTNGSKLYCHKEILKSQSPVFEAMFGHDFEENVTNQVTFGEEDCADVFEELLCYFYTGKINKLEQFALEFIAIADKFLLKELKHIVEGWLVKNITTDSMIHILIHADTYDAPKLKLEAKRFIHRHANHIINSQLFQRLIREKPHLISELYFDSVLGDNKNIA